MRQKAIPSILIPERFPKKTRPKTGRVTLQWDGIPSKREIVTVQTFHATDTELQFHSVSH